MRHTRRPSSAMLSSSPLVMLAGVLLSAVTALGGCSTGGFAWTNPATTVPATSPTRVEHGTQAVIDTAINPYLRESGPVPEDALNRFNFSKSAMAQSDWVTAREGLVVLVQDYPNLSGPALNLALVFQRQSDQRRAEQWFKASIERNSNNLLAYNQYGIFLREQGRFNQAKDMYLRALSVWEAYADTHRNIGILYDLYRGEKKAALQHFYRYQELSGGEDRVIAGWIADIERQLNSVAGVE